MSYGLGIDLGTSFTRAAISGGGQTRMIPLDGGSVLLPSVVRVQADGSLIAGEPDVGHDDPFRTGRDFKHRLGSSTGLVLGGRPYSAADLLAATLTSVVESIAATEGGPPKRVVLTHPATWDSHRRREFAGLAGLAGLSGRGGLDPAVVTTMTEPEAATNHFAVRGHVSKGDVVAVLDLGGGSFDSTVVRRTGTGTEILGTPEELDVVGADNIDDAILAYVDHAVDGALSALDPRELASAIALRRVRAECIRAKQQLSREDATNIPVLLPDRHFQVRLSRTEFEALISPTLEAALTGLHRALRSASIRPEDLTAVLLVGGSSRIPLVARRLSADLGRPVLTDPHPQHCVALGAGAIAGHGLSGSTVARSGRRRRMMIAATATTAVLAGVGVYAAGALPPPSDTAKNVVAEQVPSPTAPPTGTVITPSPPTASPTQTPTPQRTTPSAKPTKRATPKPARPKSPPLPYSGIVLGLEAQCLDVANASPQNGTTIQTTSCNGTAAQIWNLRTDHTFRALGKCMDLGPAAGETGRPVQLQECNGTAGQRWQLLDGKIVNAKSPLCLDIVGNNPADRIPTEASPCRSDAAQQWKLG